MIYMWFSLPNNALLDGIRGNSSHFHYEMHRRNKQIMSQCALANLLFHCSMVTQYAFNWRTANAWKPFPGTRKFCDLYLGKLKTVGQNVPINVLDQRNAVLKIPCPWQKEEVVTIPDVGFSPKWVHQYPRNRLWNLMAKQVTKILQTLEKSLAVFLPLMVPEHMVTKEPMPWIDNVTLC